MLPKVSEYFTKGLHNDGVRRKTQAAIGEYDELLTMVKKWKLRWFDHILRSSGLAEMIPQDTVKGKEGAADRRRGGKTILRVDRGGLCRLNGGKTRWKYFVSKPSVVPQRSCKVTR